MRKYGYFYNSDNILTFIDDAIKGEIYTNLAGIEFIVREGDVNIKHYAIKNRLNHLSFSSAGGGESPEHWYAKMKIVYELKYYDDIFNQYVHFAKVVPEKGINGKIPDLSCYDEKDNLVMLIEIKCTNEKSIEDIEKLAVNKVPLVEIDIKNDNKCKHLILTKELESNRQRFEEIRRKSKEYIKKHKERIRAEDSKQIELAEKIEKNYGDIDKFKEGIRTNGTERTLSSEGGIRFFREGIRQAEQGIRTDFREQIQGINREAESRNKRFRDAIRDCNKEGERIERDIKTYKREISNIDEAEFKNDYRLGKVEAEIDRVESEIKDGTDHINKVADNCKIEWFRSKWMKSPVNNKIEEIRYWCS